MMKRFLSVVMIVALLAIFTLPALASSKVTTDSVNLRKGAGLSYSVVRTVPKGVTLECGSSKVDKRGITWYRTTYKGKTGWVSEVYLKNPSSSSQKIVAAQGETYVRSGHSLSSKKLTVMPKGASATYLGKMSKDSRGVWWYKVKYNGTTGWVSSKYTKRG